MDDIRQRFLRDRVLTATPAQRVVMLYDRLALDLVRARTATTPAGEHLGHAGQIVAELSDSLDESVGGPAQNLAALYGYALRTILHAQLSGDLGQLPQLEAMVGSLRESWAAVADGSSATGGSTIGSEATRALRPAALVDVRWSA